MNPIPSAQLRTDSIVHRIVIDSGTHARCLSTGVAYAIVWVNSFKPLLIIVLPQLRFDSEASRPGVKPMVGAIRVGLPQPDLSAPDCGTESCLTGTQPRGIAMSLDHKGSQ